MIIVALFILTAIAFLTEHFLAKIRRKAGADYNITPKSLAVSSAFSIAAGIAGVTLIYADFFAVLKITPYKFAVISVCGVFFAALRLLNSLRKNSKKILSAVSVLSVVSMMLLTALFAEVFIFNFRSVQSLEYKKIETSESMIIGSGFKPYTNKNGEKVENTYQISNFNWDSATLEFPDLNAEIENVYLDVRAYDKKGEPVEHTVHILITDEGNALYNEVNSRRVVGTFETLRYMKLQTAGVSEKIMFRISVDTEKVDRIEINGATFNTPRPMDFSVIRLVLVFLILLFLFIIRPKSRAYEFKLRFGAKQMIAVICVIVILMAAMSVLVGTSGYFSFKRPSGHHSQYQALADSLLNGRVDLPWSVAKCLNGMENPFDTRLRDRTMAENGEFYSWDTAFHDGKYYVYFGVVPAVLTFLPYKLISGHDMPNFLVAWLFITIAVIAVFGLVAALIRRYFDRKKISFITYILICLSIIIGGGMSVLAQYPSLYIIPIASAAAFSLLALWLWVSSHKADGKLSIVKIVFGSLFMALVAGCRPQVLIFAVLAIPIFYDSIFKKIFSKQELKTGLRRLIPFGVPFVCVAAFIMWYNYARFGSVFDFGANYNLTTNDMTSRGFNFERTPVAIFMYFFQFPKYISSFPFIRYVDLDTSYIGITIRETTFGGIYATNLFVLPTLLIGYFRKQLREKKLFAFVLIATFAAVIVAVFNAQAAGILLRYYSDFAFMLSIAAALIILTMEERLSGTNLKILRNFLFFAFIYTVFFQCVILFESGTFYRGNSSNNFYKVFELIQFWN